MQKGSDSHASTFLIGAFGMSSRATRVGEPYMLPLYSVIKVGVMHALSIPFLKFLCFLGQWVVLQHTTMLGHGCEALLVSPWRVSTRSIIS